MWLVASSYAKTESVYESELPLAITRSRLDLEYKLEFKNVIYRIPLTTHSQTLAYFYLPWKFEKTSMTTWAKLLTIDQH